MVNIKWHYKTITDPTDEELNIAGQNGWEVYATDGNIYKVKRSLK